jgi:hypothetical protein
MRKHTQDPIQSDPEVDPSERSDTDYSPSSERETEELQDDQDDSAVFDDPDVDRSAVKLLPGTGDPTDDGDVEVDAADIHLPHLPAGRTDDRPPAD